MSINGLNRNNSLDRIVGNFTTAGVSAPGAILELLVMETLILFIKPLVVMISLSVLLKDGLNVLK